LQGQANDLELRLSEIDNELATNLENRLQAQIQIQQTIVDEISSRFGREAAFRDAGLRAATIVGRNDLIDAANNGIRDMLVRQANEIRARIGAARAAGAEDLARELEGQIADIEIQVFESIQNDLRTAIERTNQRAGRQLGSLDLLGRMLDATGTVGQETARSMFGGSVSRAGIFNARANILTNQRDELIARQQQAAILGNIAVMEELDDSISELTVAIAENSKAYFQARIEDVTSRNNFVLSLNDLDKQIIELEGTLAGAPNQEGLQTNLRRRGDLLSRQRVELDNLINEARARGDDVAQQELIASLKENQIAILQNTIAIKEASNLNNIQDFSTSLWTRFRQAVFTGTGKLLPQYQMAILPPVIAGTAAQTLMTSSANTTNAQRSTQTNININQVKEKADALEIARMNAWVQSTTR
jgi:hypothetical protein